MGLQGMRCVNAMSIRGFAVLDAQSCFSPLPDSCSISRCKDCRTRSMNGFWVKWIGYVN